MLHLQHASLYCTSVLHSTASKRYFIFRHSSQILGDAVASRKDDGIKAVDIQLGQVLHLHHPLTVAEASRLHHHVPMQRPEIIINATFWN